MNAGSWPIMLTTGKHGRKVLLGWFLVLAGAAGVIAGTIQRAWGFVAAGAVLLVLGVLLVRWAMGKAYPAYRPWRR